MAFDIFKSFWGPPDPRFNETGIINPFTDLPHIYSVRHASGSIWGLCYMDRNPRDSAWAFFLRHAVEVF